MQKLNMIWPGFKLYLLLSIICVVRTMPYNETQSHRIVKRIVGGDSARIVTAPFVVQLILNNKPRCTGSLVAPDTVLTAGHCT